MQLCGSLSILWDCLSLGLEWKLTFSSPSGHCWVFQICWHIECNTFTASSFRIWNSSTGIPSLPVALFIVMLPKAHLTSNSRMSGSRWVITPLWLSGSWRSFLYSSVYSCHLFLISSASIRSIPFLATVYRITKSWTLPKWPCRHRRKTFLLSQLCPSKSWACRQRSCLGCRDPDGAKCPGTASAAGVLALSESFFDPLVVGNQKAILANLSP